ncbi:sensor histidine kinase [Subtercola boreus]|nr:histidine kinase [Subtercola boreus]
MTSAERPVSSPETATAAGRSVVVDDLRLPRPPGVFRQFFARHPWVVDSAIVVLFGLPATLFVLVTLAGGRGDVPNVAGTILAVVGSLLVIVALYLRRRHPLLLVGVVALSILLVSQTLSGPDQIAPFVALYGAAVYVSVRAAWLSFGVLAVARMVAGLIALGGDLGATIAMSLFSVFLMMIATLIGINVGNGKRYVEALLDRAAQLARERDQQALLAAASERARIAREMHDIVAHSLTVMVTLADGADRTIAVNPERAQEAIRQVAETGRVALADMRLVLGVLSKPLDPAVEAAGAAPGAAPGTAAGADSPEAPDAPGGPAGETLGAASDAPASLTPQPGHNDLAALISSFRSAGMVVVYTVSGAIAPDSGLQLTVFRIVQEALTNSLRYAPDPKHVVVTVVYGPREVSVTVADEGQSQVAAPSIGTGNGIMGMRERVRGYGGSLEAGPTTAGGWQLRAVIPQREQVA